MTAARSGVPVPTDTLVFELVSVSPLDARELAGRAAAVLDAAGDLAPTLGGLSARTRRLDATGLRGVAAASPDTRANGLWLVFEQRSIGLWGDVRLYDDLQLASSPRFHSAGFRMPLARLIEQEALRERAIALLCDLFAALNGFYGSIDSSGMRTRRIDLRTAAAEAGTMWLPRWTDPRFVIWDRWVEDVWWVNLFGPAFVERWGAAVVERLGVARAGLANGGVVIRSSALPRDPGESATIGGYAHKQSFQAALGIETFIHESLEIPEPGSRVPTLDEHRRAAELAVRKSRARASQVRSMPH